MSQDDELQNDGVSSLSSGQRVTLQLGEFANMSMVHLWNAMAFGKYPAAVTRSFFEETALGSLRPRACIVSSTRNIRGVLETFPLQNMQHSDLVKPIDAAQAWTTPTGYWTDFNFGVEFSTDRNYFEIDESSTASFIESYYNADMNAEIDGIMEERVRVLVEACDSLNGFQVIGQDAGMIGSLQLKIIQHLQEEYGKSEMVVACSDVGLEVANATEYRFVRKTDAVEKAVQMALTQQTIVDRKNISWLPLCNHQAFSRSETANYLSKFYGPLNDQVNIPRYMSSVYADLFGMQQVPGRGRFGTLKVTKEDGKILDFNHLTPVNAQERFQLPRPHTHYYPLYLPLGSSGLSEAWDSIQLAAWVDFASKPFAETASTSIRQLRTQSSRALLPLEFSVEEFQSEIIETLHGMVDLAASEPEDI
jgi:hypothetical protein